MTAREAEVLALIARAPDERADRRAPVHLVRTVESHVSALLRKLQLPDRREPRPARRGRAGSRGTGSRAGARLPTPTTPFDRPDRRAGARWPRRSPRTAWSPRPVRAASARPDSRSASRPTSPAPTRRVVVRRPRRRSPTRRWSMRRGRRDDRRHRAARRARSTPTLLASLAEQRRAARARQLRAPPRRRPDCVERILAACPGVTVLATSRSRLLAPYEWVYEVPGLSVTEDGRRRRRPVRRPRGRGDRRRRRRRTRDGSPALCRALDGMALAIELAAARLSTLGLDGLESGLDQRLRFLTRRHALADRHRSLRDAIGWSYDLLSAGDQVPPARGVACSPRGSTSTPPHVGRRARGDRADLADGLARLAGTACSSSVAANRRGTGHSRRSASTATSSSTRPASTTPSGLATSVVSSAQAPRWRLADPDDEWCASFDHVLEDLRASLQWASAGDPSGERQLLSWPADLPDLLFLRGRHDGGAATLRAGRRPRGDDRRTGREPATGRRRRVRSLRGQRHAAAPAGARPRRPPTPATGPRPRRTWPGWRAHHPRPRASWPRSSPSTTPGDCATRRHRALGRIGAPPRPRSPPRPACCSRGQPDEWTLSRLAVDLAHAIGDGCLESAALDQLCAVELTRDDLPEAVRQLSRRGDVVDALPVEAASAMEHLDFRLMGSEVLLAAGDLVGAARHADILAACRSSAATITSRSPGG